MKRRCLTAQWRVATALVTLVCVGGCASQADRDEAELRHGVSGEQDRLDLPTVSRPPEEIRAEMKQFEPFSPEFEEERLRLLVALDIILQQEGVEGFVKQMPTQHGGDQTAVVDHETGRLAWRAMTCFNPDCSGEGKGGGPFLFVHPFSNFQLGSDGELVIGPFDVTELERNPLVCPACGEQVFIRPYDSPKTVLRRRQLVDQLAAVRHARNKGKRSVKEIMIEMGTLPKLFLVPED